MTEEQKRAMTLALRCYAGNKKYTTLSQEEEQGIAKFITSFFEFNEKGECLGFNDMALYQFTEVMEQYLYGEVLGIGVNH